MQRLNRLSSNSAVGIRPDRRRLVTRGADRAHHRLRRPGRWHAYRQRTQPTRSDKAEGVKRELLEVREMDFATVHRIQIRALRSLKRPLDDRMRNTKPLRKRPVAPSLIVGEQPTEDVDIGILDHDENCIRYQYMIRRVPSAGVYLDRGSSTAYRGAHSASGPCSCPIWIDPSSQPQTEKPAAASSSRTFSSLTFASAMSIGSVDSSISYPASALLARTSISSSVICLPLAVLPSVFLAVDLTDNKYRRSALLMLPQALPQRRFRAPAKSRKPRNPAPQAGSSKRA